MFTSCSTCSALLGLLFWFAALAPAQLAVEAETGGLDPRLLQAEIDLGDLSALVRPLTRIELETVVARRMDPLHILLNEIAQYEVDLNETDEARKQEMLEFLNELYLKRSLAAERIGVVLASLEAKGGDATEHRQYLKATGGSTLSVKDPHALTTAVKGWLTSREGGQRWGLNLLKALGILFLAVLVSRLAVRVTAKGLKLENRMSQLLEKFILRTIRWLVLFGGVLIALTMFEIDVGPILAFIGAGGFIIGFALKDALGNFASGILILFYRPFDVGHSIEVAGITGKVSDMNLVSTIVHTFDNKEVIIPNNTVWKDVITNSNATHQRRVDMIFSIGHSENVEQAQAILERLCEAHPKVLKEPATTVKVDSLGPSSVNFVCRPWVATSDFGDVKWDLMRSVKTAFDEAGIQTSIPQQAIMLQSGKE